MLPHTYGNTTGQDTLLSSSIAEVTVTSSQRVRKDLLPAQTLTGKELERLSAHSVADALRYFSGVQIKDYGGVGGLKTVNIRSMGTNHAGVFYDGIELGNAQNGQIDLGRFSLDNMESISLYNGQRSAIFQSAKDFGSAGTVYLQSREPVFKDGRTWNLRAVLKAGSFGLVNPSLTYERKLSRAVSASFSADYMYTNGRYKFRAKTAGGYDTTAVRQNGQVSAVRIEHGLFGHISGGEWRAKAYLYRSARGIPGAVVRGKLKNDDDQWDTNVFAQGSLRKQVSGMYSVLVNAKYAYDYLHYLSDPRQDSSTMYINNKYHQHEVYVSAANLLTLSSHWSASLAVDYQWNKLNANLYKFPYPVRHTTLVSAAMAADYGYLKAQASLLATFVNDRTGTDTAAMSGKSEYTPAVAVAYKPFSDIGLNLRGFYKRIFRMPTLNDLYYTFIGNIKLKPEYTSQYNLGLTYSVSPRSAWLRRMELQADAYYNTVENKIVAVPATNMYRWTMMNLGEVEIRGADVAVQTEWRLPPGIALNMRMSYTYQKAQDFTSPGESNNGAQIPYIPWHSGSVVINGAWRAFELDYSFIYTGERYEQQDNTPANHMPAWYTSDLALSYNMTTRLARMRLTAEINNLFNQQFEVIQCYPMPGTNFKLILRMQI